MFFVCFYARKDECHYCCTLATSRWPLAVVGRLFMWQTIILLCVCTVCTSCRYPPQPTIWCAVLLLPNQTCFRACYLSRPHLSTNWKIQLIHSQPMRRSWPQEMEFYCHLHTGPFLTNLSPYLVSLRYPHSRQCQILSCFINLRIDARLRGILYNEYTAQTLDILVHSTYTVIFSIPSFFSM